MDLKQDSAHSVQNLRVAIQHAIDSVSFTPKLIRIFSDGCPTHYKCNTSFTLLKKLAVELGVGFLLDFNTTNEGKHNVDAAGGSLVNLISKTCVPELQESIEKSPLVLPDVVEWCQTNYSDVISLIFFFLLLVVDINFLFIQILFFLNRITFFLSHDKFFFCRILFFKCTNCSRLDKRKFFSMGSPKHLVNDMRTLLDEFKTGIRHQYSFYISSEAEDECVWSRVLSCRQHDCPGCIHFFFQYHFFIRYYFFIKYHFYSKMRCTTSRSTKVYESWSVVVENGVTNIT